MQSDCQGVKLSPHRTVKQRERGPSITGPEPNVPRRMVLAAALTAIASGPALEGQLVREASFSKTMPLHYMGLLLLAERLRKRELSPVEVINAQLARIAALEPKLMAFDTITADRAIAQAKIAEREISAGRYRGPLHGIPIAVKDSFFTNEVSTRGGLKVYANHIPKFDATAVERVLRAGAVLVGKLSMAEGAGGGYHRDFRVPRNPWGANRWPGVSSSGSGVATAAGLCYASLATDTGRFHTSTIGRERSRRSETDVGTRKPAWNSRFRPFS